ncbi:MAG: zinc protease [Algoriphagus sp.]|jgi:zinc protease
MLNRTQPPQFKAIQAIELPEIKKEVLQNNLNLYTAGFAKQDVLKIELIFNAGSAFEKKSGISSIFSQTLLGGTTTRTGAEVIGSLDQYGGFIELSSRVERFHMILYGIPKFIEKYLSILKDILENAVFPEEEIELQKKLALQGLKLNLDKSTFLAGRTFKKLLFGDENPYGKTLNKENLEAVNRADLMDFYQDNIQGRSFKIFISGNVGPKEELAVKNTFGKINYISNSALELTYPKDMPKRQELVEMKDKLQSTIRLGKPMFDRKHPDFFKMLVTNTAFGGYFGSRLMKNIREEKGFTYGISSSFTPLNGFGYLLIGSDVVKENTAETFDEIGKEIKELQTKSIGKEELEAVKNYMCGSFAGSLTTAFEIVDKHKNLIIYDLNIKFYNDFITEINAVNSDDILEMATKYLDLNSMSEVVVGERI